jgi:hypothetical protein
VLPKWRQRNPAIHFEVHTTSSSTPLVSMIDRSSFGPEHIQGIYNEKEKRENDNF